MRAMVQSFRVRKLTGKPAFLTIADCESEARRIHLGRTLFRAGQQRLPNPLRLALWGIFNGRFNLSVLFWRKPRLDEDAAQLGLWNLRSANFRFHKTTLCITKRNVDSIYFLSYDYAR